MRFTLTFTLLSDNEIEREDAVNKRDVRMAALRAALVAFLLAAVVATFLALALITHKATAHAGHSAGADTTSTHRSAPTNGYQ